MNWRVIWKSLKHPDMRNRILGVLGILLVFRLLAHVPIPLADKQTLSLVLENLFATDTPQLLNFLNIASGGALANFSIMLVGLLPYINASIIMQLLTRAIPKLETLNKEGEFGRKKINQYTRMLTFPLALIQSVGMIFLVRQAAVQVGGIGDITAGVSLSQWALMVLSLTGGAMVLMWLGELITERGIGNGISLLIAIGIVSELPVMIEFFATSIIDHDRSLELLGASIPINSQVLITAAIMALGALIVTVFVVKLNEAQRRLTINYAKRVQGSRAYGGVTTTLPVKLIAAGVIPIIFAVAFLSVPSFLGQILTGVESDTLRSLGEKLSLWFANPDPSTFARGGLIPYIYPATYFTLVVLFTFFYTNIQFNAKEIAENLQKQGGFIEGVRSGKSTEKYLSKVVNRLTLFGSVALGCLAILPIIGQVFLTTSIALEGISILILVAVGLETLRHIESRALMVTYDQYDQPDFFGDLPPEDSDDKQKKTNFLKKLSKKPHKK